MSNLRDNPTSWWRLRQWQFWVVKLLFSSDRALRASSRSIGGRGWILPTVRSVPQCLILWEGHFQNSCQNQYGDSRTTTAFSILHDVCSALECGTIIVLVPAFHLLVGFFSCLNTTCTSHRQLASFERTKGRHRALIVNGEKSFQNPTVIIQKMTDGHYCRKRPKHMSIYCNHIK